MSDLEIEKEIQDKGLTAPRVAPNDIENNISAEIYFNAGVVAKVLGMPHDPAYDLLSFCVLKLNNGFTVTGESACASPENFDEALGQKIARQNAVNKVWPLMGYELKQRLSKEL